MKIAVFGIGYVGLANAALLAQKNEVVCVDVDEQKVGLVNEGKSPIADVLLQEKLSSGKLNIRATLDAAEALEGAEFALICTPTDYAPERDFFDTSSVESVLESCITTAVIRSTVPVGFTERICAEKGYERVLFAPEFLREGRALFDLFHPDRIVIGAAQKNRAAAEKFAGLLVEGAEKKDAPVFYMGTTEAEAVKLFANTYLALRVAFFNELDTYGEMRGLDTEEIIEAVCADARIGGGYNNPSFGYGGYCLPKDTKQLKANFKDVPENLISAIVDANRTRKDHIVERILAKAGFPANESAVIGIYRLTMKTDSDNFRHSAALGILKRLMKIGAKVVVFEPTLSEEEFFGAKVEPSFEKFKKEADVIIANRKTSELSGVADKVYTRDLFGKD